MFIDADGRLVVAGTASQQGSSSFAVSCYDPGTSSLGVQVNDVPPTLQVLGNQVATAGQELDLSPWAGSCTRRMTGDFQLPDGLGRWFHAGHRDRDYRRPRLRNRANWSGLGGQHTYDTAGDYYVVATVTDPDGGSATQTTQ